MAGSAELVILARMRDEASRVMSGMAGNIERHANTIRKAGMVMAAAGAVITAALVSATKSAIDEEIGIKRLDLVLQKVGSSYERVREPLEKQIRATQLATSYGDELQREILGKLVPVFGNYEEAVMALPLVLDAMALSGRSADTVVSGLGRALAGQVNTATSVGIAFDKDMDTMERFALVQSKIGGLAQEMVDPFEQVKNAVGDLAQAIAGPLIEPMTTMLNKFAEIALKLSEVNPGLMTFVSISAAAAGVLLTVGGAVAMMLPTIMKTVKILKSWAAVQAVITALTGPWGIALAAAAVATGIGVAKAVGAFQYGGTVPGPAGQPQLAIVHGGEKYAGVNGQYPIDGGESPTVIVKVEGGLFLNDDRDMDKLAVAVAEAQRRMSRGTTGRNP